MNTPSIQYLSMRDAARISGINRRVIGDLLRKGTIKGRRGGRSTGWWYLEAGSFQEYAKEKGITLDWDKLKEGSTSA